MFQPHPTHPLSPTSARPPDAIPNAKASHLSHSQSPTIVSHLVPLFPYNTAQVPTTDSSPPVEESEARKAGFRALSKEPWVRLQAEYAEYCEILLRRIAAGEATPLPTKLNTHSTALHLPLSHRSRCRCRSHNHFPPDACFLRGMCLQTRTKLHYAPAFLHCSRTLVRLIM